MIMVENPRLHKNIANLYEPDIILKYTQRNELFLRAGVYTKVEVYPNLFGKGLQVI